MHLEYVSQGPNKVGESASYQQFEVAAGGDAEFSTIEFLGFNQETEQWTEIAKIELNSGLVYTYGSDVLNPQLVPHATSVFIVPD